MSGRDSAYFTQTSGADVFPIEFRYVKADDIWLSPFISVTRFRFRFTSFINRITTIFDLIEPILQKYQGRPHWGKLHSMSAASLRDLYPKWDDFMRVRQQLDPQKNG